MASGQTKIDKFSTLNTTSATTRPKCIVCAILDDVVNLVIAKSIKKHTGKIRLWKVNVYLSCKLSFLRNFLVNFSFVNFYTTFRIP